MNRVVLTVGSTMRIPLLYRGEYSEWVERFMNYLEEQTDGEAMINSIKNGNQPLPRVTQVSITRTTSTEQPPLKDKSMWSDQENRVQKIDRLERSLLIQGLPNDIYSLIDSNKTAKDLWDALATHMLGSEYGEQDRKAAVLYEYETFKATEGELLLDTYIRYLQVINDLKKCGYSKDNYVNDAMGSKKKTVVVTSDPLALIVEKTNAARGGGRAAPFQSISGRSASEADDFSELKKITALLAKAFNRRKFYSKPTNNNLRTSSSSQSANKKQEFVETDNKRVKKKDDEKKRDMSKVKCYNYKKKGHFAKDCKKAKVKDYEYYKTKMLLAKKDKDEQVLLAEDQAWMESSSDSDQEINANMVFMAQIEKVLSDSEASSSSADEKISEVSYYLSESESESKFETSEYYDNSTNYSLFVNNDDDQEIFHDAIKSASENFIEKHIDSQKDYDKSDVNHNDSKEKDQLVDKLIRKFNKKIVKCHNRVEKANQQSKDFENQNKDLEDKYDVLKNQTTTFEINNNEMNEQMKELIEKNNDFLAQTKSANKKQEFVKSVDKKVEKKNDEKKRDMSRVKCYYCKKEGHFAKDCKKAKVKDYEYYNTKMLLAKKDKDKQVFLAEDQAWMESSSDLDQEINANMVFMTQIEKVLSDSEASLSSADEKISEKFFMMQLNLLGENFIENHIDSQKDYDKSDVDHNDSEEKDQLVDKLIRKFNKKIVKYHNRVEKANQQSKDFKNQNKDLQDKYDVLKNQSTTFEINNNELNEQIKELIKKNNDLLTQTKVLKDQLQVKHVVIDTHVECQEKYAKLEAERYEYMIRYSAYFDNDKQHRKHIADQQVLFDKMCVQLVELDKHVRDLKNTMLEKDFKISKLEECVRNKDLEIEKCLERLNVYENKLHKMGQTNQTVHMIMPSKDNLYNGRK
nr:hypothetical protein [Tanacetum cinerariifolium]